MDADAHYSESKDFKAYCREIMALLKTHKEPVSIRYIHDQLGRDRIHMTLDVLEWMYPTIDVKEYGVVTRYFIDTTLRPKKKQAPVHPSWQAFIPPDQREARKEQERRRVWARRW